MPVKCLRQKNKPILFSDEISSYLSSPRPIYSNNSNFALHRSSLSLLIMASRASIFFIFQECTIRHHLNTKNSFVYCTRTLHFLARLSRYISSSRCFDTFFRLSYVFLSRGCLVNALLPDFLILTVMQYEGSLLCWCFFSQATFPSGHMINIFSFKYGTASHFYTPKGSCFGHKSYGLLDEIVN